MKEHTRIGYQVIGTIIQAKGHCHAGHKLGERIELDVHNARGICGFLYHNAFPYLVMLQFGGGFPADWGNPDTVEIECPDKQNAVTLELNRLRE